VQACENLKLLEMFHRNERSMILRPRQLSHDRHLEFVIEKLNGNTGRRLEGEMLCEHETQASVFTAFSSKVKVTGIFPHRFLLTVFAKKKRIHTKKSGQALEN